MHWSSRESAQQLGNSPMIVPRMWRRAGLKPYLIEGCMTPNEPDFDFKAADILGLYVKSPHHVAVLLVDEKTAIQVPDRLDSVLPFSPGGGRRATALSTSVTTPRCCTLLLTPVVA